MTELEEELDAKVGKAPESAAEATDAHESNEEEKTASEDSQKQD